MKILICVSIFAASSSYAGFVTYPYIPTLRAPVVFNDFYPGNGGLAYSSFGGHSLAAFKPIYGGFYDYRLGLTPNLYHYGVYPGSGVYAAAPTIIHLLPADAGSNKKDSKKTGKPDEGKEDETTTMGAEDKVDDVEKAEAKDEKESSKKNDEVELVSE